MSYISYNNELRNFVVTSDGYSTDILSLDFSTDIFYFNVYGFSCYNEIIINALDRTDGYALCQKYAFGLKNIDDCVTLNFIEDSVPITLASKIDPEASAWTTSIGIVSAMSVSDKLTISVTGETGKVIAWSITINQEFILNIDPLP